MRTTCSTEVTKILPSPIFPVRADLTIASMASSRPEVGGLLRSEAGEPLKFLRPGHSPDLLRRLHPVHAVQVQGVLHHPVAASQAPQYLARYAIAQVGELDAGVERVVHRQRARHAFGEHRTLVAPRLGRHRRRGGPVQRLAA